MKVKEIIIPSSRKYHTYGVIRGITTNPTILIKEGIELGIINLRN